MPLNTICSTKWEMPVSSNPLLAGPGADLDTDRDAANVPHAFGDDAYAVGQDGPLNFAGLELTLSAHSTLFYRASAGSAARRKIKHSKIKP